MSKPDPTGAKSLEEILASIRKSLADEPAARQPELPVAPAQAALPRPEAGAARTRCRGPSKPMAPRSLAGKLAAGLLNGAVRRPPAIRRRHRATCWRPRRRSRSRPRPSMRRSRRGQKRCQGPPVVPDAPVRHCGTDARRRDRRRAPATLRRLRRLPPRSVKLSRPETLRPSLPPLFGAGSEPIPPAARTRGHPRRQPDGEDRAARCSTPKSTARRATAKARAARSP